MQAPAEMLCVVAGCLEHSPILQSLKTKSSDHQAKGISEFTPDVLVLVPFVAGKDIF